MMYRCFWYHRKLLIVSVNVVQALVPRGDMLDRTDWSPLRLDYLTPSHPFVDSIEASYHSPLNSKGVVPFSHHSTAPSSCFMVLHSIAYNATIAYSSTDTIHYLRYMSTTSGQFGNGGRRPTLIDRKHLCSRASVVG